MTQTLTEDVTELEPATGEPKVAHYVHNTRGEVTAGYLGETELEALCGHRWVPKTPVAGLPICAQCLAVYNDNEAMAMFTPDRTTS